jgi:hypothetical protein
VAVERLLWFCLRHTLSLRDEGIVLSFKDRREDETILVFKTDSAAFREQFYRAGDLHSACEGIVFYKHAEGPPVLVFAELKGADVPYALQQLRCTIEAVKPGIEATVEGKTKYLALVVTDRAAPMAHQPEQRAFEGATEVELYVVPARRGKGAVDLREVLRGIARLSLFVAA